MHSQLQVRINLSPVSTTQSIYYLYQSQEEKRQSKHRWFPSYTIQHTELFSLLDRGLSRCVLTATEEANQLDIYNARPSISIAHWNIRKGSQTKASGEGGLLSRVLEESIAPYVSGENTVAATEVSLQALIRWGCLDARFLFQRTQEGSSWWVEDMKLTVPLKPSSQSHFEG